MFKQVMSSVLIATQIGFAATAIAATDPGVSATAAAASPEVTLLQRAIALEGETLPKDEMQTQFSKIIMDYASNAPTEGQQERMEQALVTLKMYTRGQAHQLMNDVVDSSQTLTGATASAEIARLASTYPSGAQFSACDLGGSIAEVSLVGGLAGVVIWALSSGQNGTPQIKTGAELLTSISAAGLIVGVVLVVSGLAGDC